MPEPVTSTFVASMTPDPDAVMLAPLPTTIDAVVFVPLPIWLKAVAHPLNVSVVPVWDTHGPVNVKAPVIPLIELTPLAQLCGMVKLKTAFDEVPVFVTVG